MSNGGAEEQNSRNNACAACKHQRRKCDNNCVFAPYFPSTKANTFRLVHKVFGVKNVTGILKNLSHEERKRAVASLEWEARAWKDDRVDGPLGLFSKVERELEDQLSNHQHNNNNNNNNNIGVPYSNYQPNSGLIGVNHNAAAAAVPAFVPNSNFNATDFGYDNTNPSFGIPYNNYGGLPPIGLSPIRTTRIENQRLQNNSVFDPYYTRRRQVQQRSLVIRERGDHVVQPSTPTLITKQEMQQRNQVMGSNNSPILMSQTNSFSQQNYQQVGSQPIVHGYLEGSASQSQGRCLQ